MAKRKEAFGEKTFNILNTIFLFLIIIVTIYPLYYVLLASFSDPVLFMSQGVNLIPSGFSLDAYKSVLQNPMIGYGYRNTFFILGIGLIINISLTILAGFIFSRKNVMLAKGITLIAVFTMFFSGGMIPNYLQVERLGLVDSLFSLILPSAIIAIQ